MMNQKIKVANGWAGVGDRVIYKSELGDDECELVAIDSDYHRGCPICCAPLDGSGGLYYASEEYAEKKLVLLNIYSEEGIKELFDILLSD